MQILLVAATKAEIAPFLMQRPASDFLVTGIGSAEAVYHITKRLSQIDYDLVIQAGIAGSFTHSLQLGDVAIVKQDRFADLGVSEKDNLYTMFEKGFSDKDLFPFSDGWLVNNDPVISRFQLQHVNAVTVNMVSDSDIQLKQFILKFEPQLETMEGAALHYVCLQENVSFLQLRSISNYVGERDKAKWRITDAIDNLNDTLFQIVDQLTG